VSAIEPGASFGRRLGPILAVVLLLAVGGGIYWSNQQQQLGATGTLALIQAQTHTLRGAVGSEKLDFFGDERVQAAFAKHGFKVQVDRAGSREIASLPNLKQYDFAFPAGEPAAVKIQQTVGVTKSFVPFYSVMTVASWQPIAKILEANGLVQKQNGFWYILDMRAFLELAAKGKRWKDLKASDAYSISRSVLISTTDVRKSNSAAMYLSIASYVFNGDAVVETDSDAAKVLPSIVPLFMKQGWQDNSSAGPFEDYQLIGMGKTPLVMIYEAQFFEQLIKNQALQNKDQMVLLYPRPTVYAKQTFIPLSPDGEKLGALLESDPELQQLAAEFGWRTKQPQAQLEVWKSHGVDAPQDLVDIVNPPRFEMVEALIRGIEDAAAGKPQEPKP
jgi:hypothetical protein